MLGTLELAVIEISEELDIYTIFGRMNANGTPLSQADLIKNAVMKAITKIENIHTQEMVRQLWPFDEGWWRADAGEERMYRSHVERFLHYWLMLKTHKFVLRSQMGETIATSMEGRGVEAVVFTKLE